MGNAIKRFVSKYYTLFGCIGSFSAFLNILAVIFVSIGIMRAEYNMFSFLVLPNFISKLIVSVWLYYYTYSTSYGKDIRELAKMILGVIAINILFVALDESTVTYYFIQAVANLALVVFMCILTSRCRYASRNKRHATVGFVALIFMYLLIAFIAITMFLSFTSYDPYLVTFTGVSHLCVTAGFVFMYFVEKNTRGLPKG